ncbi:LOB domain-containing protein 30-like isoform X2 [Arachis ipaensis]|uniref:LOB domain-containing protein 30-like isoform X2 n=1 Tax=Arachis ipaensis TaxID=130454 RepID=UPI000A2B28F1|nr:LOB domain-containing protein 30-like isoform X2 [Arachis ipaensis]
MSASTSRRGGGGSSGASGSGTKGRGSGGPCGACKFLRRKCAPGCVFAPYFDPDQGATYFASVHKVFGASNVGKLLSKIPAHKRLDAVITICYEAQARMKDPVYGCVGQICTLQQQVLALQAELSFLQNHLATMEIRQPPPIPPTQGVPTSTVFSVADLPTVVGVAPATLSMPTTFDLSSHFDPATAQASWAVYQRAMMDPRQYMAVASPIGPTAGGGVDLQTVARELINRHVPLQAPPQAFGSNAASMSAPSLSSSK